MEKVSKIIKKIEEFAPLETMQKWDNSGWQINLGNEDTHRILLALDVTPAVVDEAIKKKCDLILSHHPVFFNSIKTMDSPFIIKAIQNNIQVYSAHTNLDIAQGGAAGEGIAADEGDGIGNGHSLNGGAVVEGEGLDHADGVGDADLVHGAAVKGVGGDGFDMVAGDLVGDVYGLARRGALVTDEGEAAVDLALADETVFGDQFTGLNGFGRSGEGDEREEQYEGQESAENVFHRQHVPHPF
jgi:hypothetical protein